MYAYETFISASLYAYSQQRDYYKVGLLSCLIY